MLGQAKEATTGKGAKRIQAHVIETVLMGFRVKYLKTLEVGALRLVVIFCLRGTVAEILISNQILPIKIKQNY